MSEQSAMWWVAHVIFESAQGPNPSFFFFFVRLWGLLGHGLGLGFGPGLDNTLLTLQTLILEDSGVTPPQMSRSWAAEPAQTAPITAQLI